MLTAKQRFEKFWNSETRTHKNVEGAIAISKHIDKTDKHGYRRFKTAMIMRSAMPIMKLKQPIPL
jgi:hypothetical protein